MNCSDAKRHLPTLADGELGAELAGPLERHLAACPACAASLGRWQALRQSARRGTGQAAAPMGLRAGVLGQLGRARNLRRVRAWTLTPLAAAALILLAFMVWPQREPVESPVLAQAVSVNPQNFAFIYHYCARGSSGHPHDELNVCNQCPDAARPQVARQVQVRRPLVPNLAAQSFHLAGACRCTPGGRQLPALHAFYEKDGDPTRIVSFFSLGKPIMLVNGAGTRPPDRCRGQREYVEAHERDVTVITWHTGTASYAVCGNLPESELFNLAETVDVAAIFERPRLLAAGAPLPLLRR